MKKRQNGLVRWFNKLSGDGVIRSENGKSYPVYGCNLIGAKTMFQHTCCIYLVQGEAVKFDLHSNLGAVNVSGGHFDAEKWNSLDHFKLSFKIEKES